FHDKDLNQVTVRKLANSLGASPAAILFGSNELERDFTLKEDGSRNGMDWINALPRNKDAGFDRILIGLRGGLPEAMELRDAFGRTTVFTFSGFERNPTLEADSFRFVMPRGADIVEQ
ncbi:MAG TPA: outer-membrane lipoprotein carrier protein LolA, partial [Burkholderiaceae bacterium]|nr:outer-membrane lipoprotein carrier protein LolA [Burkholderiaceae bacterium]